MRQNKLHPRLHFSKDDMTLFQGPFGSVFGGVTPGLEFEPYVLNGLVQARQQRYMFSQTLRAIVKLATLVSSSSIEKK